MEAFGKFTLAVMLYIVALVFRGIAFSYLWKWFVVPFGLPAIGIAWALGVSGIMFFAANNPYTVTKEQSAWETLGQAIAYPLITLILGYIYTLFM